MEGPYRDLGAGFARLTGAEGTKRSPSRLACVEDALFELLRNARDAGARNVFVASTLKKRRYRALTVLDDGNGIPESYRALIFEPGVTTRHLSPVLDDAHPAPHGAGLSLYHIKNASLSAEVLSTSSPTSIKVTFDTHSLPERSLQSPSRPSYTNLLATLQNFAANGLEVYYASPSSILATLLQNHIIQQPRTTNELRKMALALGLELSLRTAQRVWRGEIAPATRVREERREVRAEKKKPSRAAGDGPVLVLGEEERGGIADILRKAATASYLVLGELELHARPGEISMSARVYEPEEEYE
jgi:hypothetical protein